MHFDNLRFDAEQLLDSRCIDLLSQPYHPHFPPLCVSVHGCILKVHGLTLGCIPRD